MTVSVAEDVGTIQVCATLSAVEATERVLTATLTTRDGKDLPYNCHV